MFQSLREEIEAACQEADRLKVEFEQHERQRAERVQLQKQYDGVGLIYKTYEPQPMAPPQQSVAAMSPEKERQWNDWFDAGIKNYLDQNKRSAGGGDC